MIGGCGGAEPPRGLFADPAAYPHRTRTRPRFFIGRLTWSEGEFLLSGRSVGTVTLDPLEVATPNAFDCGLAFIRHGHRHLEIGHVRSLSTRRDPTDSDQGEG